MTETLEAAAKLLRDAGWTVVPPADERAPLYVGQVWVSAKPGVRPRTIVGFTDSRAEAGIPGVRFAIMGGEILPLILSARAFRRWAKEHEARPLPAEDETPAERIYRETGGPTEALRVLYAEYKAAIARGKALGPTEDPRSVRMVIKAP